jgi:hypothetical protein
MLSDCLLPRRTESSKSIFLVVVKPEDNAAMS